MKLYVILPAVCLALIIVGCDLSSVDPGGGATSPTGVALRGDPAPPENGGGGGDGEEVIDLTVPPGTLVGQILYDGAAPTLPPRMAAGLITGSDKAVCSKKGDIPDESLVVDPETNGVANVFVFLDRRPKWLDEKPEWDPDVTLPGIDQEFCVFKPHALIARTGKFILKNSDDVNHNVKSGFPTVAFNPNLPKDATFEVTFRRAEKQPYPSSCALHAWMVFYTLVVDHPYAVVTDEKGMFRIPNLPQGTHEFRIWHERGGMLERKFVVEIPSDAETPVQEKKFGASKFKL